METIVDLLIPVFVYPAFAFLLIGAAKVVYDLCHPFSLDHELCVSDNVALGLSFSGYLLGVFIIIGAVMKGPEEFLAADLLQVSAWSLGSILLLNFANFVNDKVLLYQFCSVKEIITDRNCGTGAVQAGSYIASACVVAGAVNGEGGGILTLLAFFALGQILLIAFGYIYNLMTPYCIHDEIEADNVAAGVAFAGLLIGLGIILMHASGGNFLGWGPHLLKFGVDSLAALILFPTVRLVFARLLVRKLNLNLEIQKDRNLGAALLEAVAYVGFSVVLVFALG